MKTQAYIPFIQITEVGERKQSDKVLVTNPDGTTRGAYYRVLRITHAPKIGDIECAPINDNLVVWEKTGRSVDALNHNDLFDLAEQNKVMGKKRAGVITRRAVAPYVFTNTDGEEITAQTKQLVVTFSSFDEDTQALETDRAFERFESQCVKNGVAVAH